MIHVAHTDESCCTCKLVMLQIWMSHIEHIDESCRTCEWVMSDIWMSHVAHVNKSLRTYEWATSPVRMSHVAHMDGLVSHTAHGEDQTQNIWISRSISFPDRSFEWRGLRLFPWILLSNFGDSRKNLIEMFGDPRENLFEILAVVIISSPISSVCGMNESCRIYGWVTCHTYEGVMSHIWMSHVVCASQRGVLQQMRNYE